MEREELKLVFDALKQCNTYAFAGGLGLRATEHRNALAILEKALAQPAQPAQEHVGQVTEVSERGFKCEFSQRLAAGTKLYAAAPKENT